MGKLKQSTRKLLISLVGFPIIIIGIILIPLPGPGILVVILGLFILSLEFEWAKRYLESAKDFQRKAVEKARAQKERAKKDYTDEKNTKKRSKTS
jgi:uncharacterized protein (TIGR02611 family)